MLPKTTQVINTWIIHTLTLSINYLHNYLSIIQRINKMYYSITIRSITKIFTVEYFRTLTNQTGAVEFIGRNIIGVRVSG